jgi:DNA-binding CsgD family transcriptional regulator/Tfp pilus assembly protein PilF
MRYFLGCFIFLFLINNCTLNAQVNITRAWKEADPVKDGNAVTALQKLKTHEDYLKQAVAKDDITRQFYGNMYLHVDNMDDQNYTDAVTFLLAAENIARKCANVNWQGFVKLKSGWVASVVQNNSKKAIKEYETGATLSAQGNDSFCMAQCFEQLSAMYSGLKEFDSSQHYFDLAIPILRRFSINSLDGVYNNFSALLVRQKKYEAALVYIDSAIQVAQKLNNKRREIFFLANRGVMLNELKRYDSAEAVFKYCMAIDKENKWMDNLMYDYEGLSENYHDKNNDAAAYEYLNKYHFLKDSLTGVEVQLKIANLNAIRETQEKELALKQSQVALLTAKNVIQKRTGILITTLLIIVFILWMWFIQQKKEKRKRAHTLDNLEQLTRTLIEKNGMLADIEQRLLILQEKSLKDDASLEQYLHDKKILLAQITETKQDSNLNVPSLEQDEIETNIYNQRILTPSDWSAFKLYFEKAYPGYLLRLRTGYPALTEAEERMFLFIKLKLTNKEAAAILGISADSVKKTRTRLRKRLALDEKVDMDEFVKQF